MIIFQNNEIETTPQMTFTAQAKKKVPKLTPFNCFTQKIHMNNVGYKTQMFNCFLLVLLRPANRCNQKHLLPKIQFHRNRLR